MSSKTLIKSLIKAGWEKIDSTKQVYKTPVDGLSAGELIQLVRMELRIKSRPVGMHIIAKVTRTPLTYNAYLYVEGSLIKKWVDKSVTVSEVSTAVSNFCFECGGKGEWVCGWLDRKTSICALYKHGMSECSYKSNQWKCSEGVTKCLLCNGTGVLNGEPLDKQCLMMLDKGGKVLQEFRR